VVAVARGFVSWVISSRLNRIRRTLQNAITRRPRSARVAALVWLGILSRPAAAREAEPELEFIDCASISPALTTELLAIELQTLGIQVTSTMRWTVHCRGQRAQVRFHGAPDSPEVAGEPPGFADAKAHADVDLSSTDEAAWPRLIAISASELVEPRKRGASSTPNTEPSPMLQSRMRVQLVAMDVKTRRGDRTLPTLGFSFGREGNPGTNLYGVSLGVDRRLGAVWLLGADFRTEWGQSNLRNVNVRWQVSSAALGAGATLNLRVVDVDAIAGFRVGRLALTGEVTAPDLSGRSLVGTTGGPFVTLRLRRTVGRRLFFGVALEEGYSVMPVRGNFDGAAPLLSVDGLWTHVTLGIGWML